MDYTLYLTDACNMNCKYCYEGEKCDNELAIDKVKLLLTREANSKDKASCIGFFGGEPLLKKENIYEILAFCRELRKSTGHKFKYTITTNATLIDDEFLKVCKKYKINLAISIDGNKYSHDLNRCNNFDIVYTNVQKALKVIPCAKAMMTVSLNVLEYFADNVKFLIDTGFKTIICALNYLDNWQDKDIALLKQQYEKISDIYYNEMKKENIISLFPIDEKMNLYINEKKRCSEHCQFGSTRVNVGTDGNFYPCQQFMYRPEYRIGDLENGIDLEARKELWNKSTFNTSICDKCAVKKRCNYLCGCLRSIASNGGKEVTPVICETEKVIIDVADDLAERLYKDFPKRFMCSKYF